MFCAVGDVVKNLSTFTASGGQRLELRYGETCRALWLRTTGLWRLWHGSDHSAMV
ncbi:hypothetical protein ACIBJC_11060 [Streptomyces sp. NPDC050509]|uniref:hypothetical protein n=1 Tax=Streptomyces sp. NPDC050509 TaxID=3365620 RepID=UPI003797F9DC